ncbi:MAG: glutamine amidotransferase [Pirellulales bacterium]|nr:glutamine amidotransferase [Pirellulales bacterium]
MTHWHISPITDQYFSGGAYLLVAAIALGLLAVWTAAVFFTPVSRNRRVILASLRLALIFVLLFVLLRPSHTVTENEKQSATLLLLLDQSRSMQIQDTSSGDSRWKQMRALLATLEEPISRMRDEKEIEVNLYTFDNGAAEVDLKSFLSQPTTPQGSESGYGNSMQDVLQKEDGKRLLGMVLLGDGAEQTFGISEADPVTMARLLDRLGCPLYTVPFGERKGSGQVRDVEVSSLPDSFVVFAKNRVPVKGTARISGYLNRDLPLQLVLESPDGEETTVATTVVRQSDTVTEVPFEFDYMPTEPGRYKIAVRAPPQAGEVTTENNELPAMLTVLEGGIRVLYIEGEIRREQRFLRRALALSPDIDVSLLTLGPQDRKNWPRQDLAKYFKSGNYDVIILGDVDSRAFFPGSATRPADLQLLRDAVLDGQGLLMLGGWHSFRAGGYHLTPLAEIAPVLMNRKIDRFVIQQFNEPIDQSLHLPGPLVMQPTEPWGAESEIMQISIDGNNLQAWQQLPPLTGANRFRGIKPGARVLADDGKGDSLLVTAEPGGRVVAFAGDSTWRWAMKGFTESYVRFWRQVVLWLARKEKQKINDVWITLDQRRFTPGQRIGFETGVKRDTPSDKKVTLIASLLGPDGNRREIPLSRTGVNFSGTIRNCKEVGSYTLTVTVQGEESERTESTQFFVYSKDRELAGSTSDAPMLRSIANQTKDLGGRLVPPEELDDLLEEVIKTPVEMEQKIKVSMSFWDKWYVFVIFVSLISIEWFLRKMWRLV